LRNSSATFGRAKTARRSSTSRARMKISGESAAR
jgi:hypothetical protein